jgi:hypothetical protein
MQLVAHEPHAVQTAENERLKRLKGIEIDLELDIYATRLEALEATATLDALTAPQPPTEQSRPEVSTECEQPADTPGLEVAAGTPVIENTATTETQEPVRRPATWRRQVRGLDSDAAFDRCRQAYELYFQGRAWGDIGRLLPTEGQPTEPNTATAWARDYAKAMHLPFPIPKRISD